MVRHSPAVVLLGPRQVGKTTLALQIRGARPSVYLDLEAEIDLVLTLPDGRLWVVEIKRSSAPKVERGFHLACADLKPEKRFVVYPGSDRFPLDAETDAIGVAALAQALQAPE